MFPSLKKFRWGGWIVAVVLFIVFFYLLARPEPSRAPWYKQLVLTALNPVSETTNWFSGGLSGIWHNYFALVDVSKENKRLNAEVAGLKNQLVELSEVKAENGRLRSLLDLRPEGDWRLLGASVVANDPRAEFKTVTIDKGSSDGVAKGMPVVGASGVVGRVGEVGRGWARVLLITDPNSSVDALVQRSRQRAILVGMMRSVALRRIFYLTKLEYLHRTSDVQAGDVVVTSGMDGIFPPGLPVGTVQDVAKSDYGLFTRATIVPYEEMSNLEKVAVIMPAGGAAK